MTLGRTISIWTATALALMCFAFDDRNFASAAFVPFETGERSLPSNLAFVATGVAPGGGLGSTLRLSVGHSALRSRNPGPTTSRLYGIRNFLRNRFADDKDDPAQDHDERIPTSSEDVGESTVKEGFFGKSVEEVDICVIGAGVSGLLAAITAADETSAKSKIVVLESAPTVGGRVQSDVTAEGYLLDRGFAVFIEEYPVAKKVLNYTKLELGKFQPGALVKLKGESQLARVADPLRQPSTVFDALVAPVGSLLDKLKVLPLIYHVRSRTIDELFDEPETDTLRCLKDKWGFSDEIIDLFFKPFLEGIYLAPLEEQSSRMFHFVFKMFSEGAATLPKGGIGAVSKQLEQHALDKRIEIRTNQLVNQIGRDTKAGGRIRLNLKDDRKTISAKSVVLATDGRIAREILGGMEGFQFEPDLPDSTQREVACLYYGFNTSVPVLDPILILSGYGEERGTETNPVNNVCFPSVVSNGYAPEGHHLCSVTVLKDAMGVYEGRSEELDQAVRKELSEWFPFEKDDIQDKWELQGTYHIHNAQPAQLNGPLAASINGGRDCRSFGGNSLPDGLLVCGDHMATSTLNGALESGVNAGQEAANMVQDI